MTDSLAGEASVRRIAQAGTAHSCFFRSAAAGDGRKALVQITERCNLHCAHCFVSSTRIGRDFDAHAFRDSVLPRLRAARVTRLTLTGGEPFVHPQLLQFCGDAVSAGMSLGLCTNGLGVTDQAIAALASLPDVHVNVSFDGFRPDSHGRFRGDRDSFSETVEAARRLSRAGLLQGILSTPNALVAPSEYEDLASFAIEVGAEYLLMNPLSAFGRGTRSQHRLGADRSLMNDVLTSAIRSADDRLEIVPTRFPNDSLPLGGCIAGEIIYVFADGEVTVCPYLAFAARTPLSRHSESEFSVGNILQTDVAAALDEYRFHERYQVGSNSTCSSCAMSASCGKGCPAAVIAAGGTIGQRDTELCPIV